LYRRTENAHGAAGERPPEGTADRFDAVAALLRELSAEDRARVAAMLAERD
jgi:hypothetical protein